MRSFVSFRNFLLLAVFLFFPGKILRFAALLYLASDALSFVWSRSLRRSFSVSRISARLRINRHERLELSLIVSNGSRFPALSCLIFDSSDIPGSADRDARWLCSVSPGRKVRLSWSVLVSERGSYAAGPVAVSCSDPLGRYPFRIEFPAACAVLVRPARSDPAILLHGGSPLGLLPARNPAFEDSTQVRSARDYRSGDEIRRINWKLSARLGRLCTNEFLETCDCPVFVFLDLSYSRFPERHRSELSETLVELAASLIRLADAKKQLCGFASREYFIACGKNLADTILDILAVIRASHEAPPPLDSAPTETGRPEAGSSTPESVSVSSLELDRALLSRALVSLPSGASFFFVAPASPDCLVYDNPEPVRGKIVPVWKWKFVKAAEFVYEKL